MTTAPTAPSEAIRQGEVEYVDIDGENLVVELPGGLTPTAPQTLDLRRRIATADAGLRFKELVATDKCFVLVFGHQAARSGQSDATMLRRRLAKVLRAHYTTVAEVTGLVDRAPTRSHIGTTITFKFMPGERPTTRRKRSGRTWRTSSTSRSTQGATPSPCRWVRPRGTTPRLVRSPHGWPRRPGRAGHTPLP